MHARATAPRRAALAVLARVRSGELLDRAVEAEGAAMEPRDRAWLQELTYGTVRLRGRLDYVLGELVRGGTASLEPDVLDVLRLGAYQLLEMGSVPPYAAVSQSVELARDAGASRAAGLVNGVLQALRRRGRDIPLPDRKRNAARHLAVRESHPEWLVRKWLARWGDAETEALLQANNLHPELFVRPARTPAAMAASQLGRAGIATSVAEARAESLRVAPPATARDAVAAAPVLVQDPAASLVVDYAAVPPAARVLDLCAAPGGKALGLAEHSGYVVAADLSLRRLDRVRENAARLGLQHRLFPVAADARHPPFRAADAVLLDVPCSGTGTFRRHPDGRWRVTQEAISALAELQADMLEAAAPLVVPGGLLLYSTCSLEPEENEMQIDRFLDSHPEFSLSAVAGTVEPRWLDDCGRLQVTPQRSGVDGSFAARLVRCR